jgi:hypothetical protein
MNLAKIIQKLYLFLSQIASLSNRVERLQEAIARIEMRQLALANDSNIRANEFQVFSQWGEDGVIQFLLSRVQITNTTFVEFGVGDYTESNTRFLLKHNNWSGLVIDGSEHYINQIRQSELPWRHDLRTECSFITRDNINHLISSNGFSGDIGILSVDIDGNDYWIWQAIDCIQPRVVICEYNSLFGPDHKVSSVYNDNFVIAKAHFSGLYWGASIAAFNHLAQQKGYSLIGSNSIGNNIFFVRNDVVKNVPVYTPQEAYVQSKFRISRDKNGELSFLDFQAGRDIIGDMPLQDVETGQIMKVKEFFVAKVGVPC